MGSRENDKLTRLEFKENDKLTGSDDFHAWKMILDLKLEDHDLLDHVTGKIQEQVEEYEEGPRRVYSNLLYEVDRNQEQSASYWGDNS